MTNPFAAFEGWAEEELAIVGKFLGGVVKSEVAAVTPVAEAQVANLAEQEAVAVATGNSSQTGHILASVTSQTVQALEVAGITAGASSIAAAVGAAVAKAPALVAAKATS